ncbi:SGNH/GDSL hydrolase family protein [Spongiimicrobium sp. 2-473A-2-J]|uniref:SGNH/GDSL hydrolase family protein n=1 Tax=Eudoraea algarum TaxID=3417568 RepID=UPI003D36D986
MGNKKLKFGVFACLLGFMGIATAQDWPDLEHFKEENTKIGLPAEGEDRVVFMGNSITIGWLAHDPDFFKGKSYVNRGIGGQTTPQMLLRFQQDVIALRPKVVVILAGTNDIAGNTGPTTVPAIMDNLKSMAQLARANQIKVILCSVLPAFDYPWRTGKEPNIKIPALNELIRQYAKQNNLIYLDYFSAMEDGNNGLKDSYTYDGVHPDKNGYKVMGPLAEEAIAKALEPK